MLSLKTRARAGIRYVHMYQKQSNGTGLNSPRVRYSSGYFEGFYILRLPLFGQLSSALQHQPSKQGSTREHERRKQSEGKAAGPEENFVGSKDDMEALLPVHAPIARALERIQTRKERTG